MKLNKIENGFLQTPIDSTSQAYSEIFSFLAKP